jgi:flagellar biosynthesis protein FlhF
MNTRQSLASSPSFHAPAVRDLARRLLAQGASPAFAQRVVARVEALGRSQGDAHPLDLAARVIGDAFPRVVLRTPRATAAVLAVLGARGSGRSAFVRKLALRLRGAGRRVSVVAVKQRESSKPAWLATWMGEIGAFACVVDVDEAIPRRALEASDVVLVDGSGNAKRDVSIVESIAWQSDAPRIVETRVGVLASDLSPERLRAEARALRAAGAACSVLTRLDLAAAPAAAFEIASSAELPVAFASDGVDEGDHLHRCTPERAADVFLKGRIA